MPVYFNGQLLKTPATASMVNNSAMFNPNLSVGNVLAVIGPSIGGKPNTALRFGSAAQAQATLKSGDLLTAIVAAFDPSTETTGPAEIIGIRVNPATQSALALANSVPATVINLLSQDYGAYTNQVKVKIESGSVSGKLLTTQIAGNYYSQDNVARNAFSVVYAGSQVTATATIDNTAQTLVLAAPAGTTVATIALATFPTVQQLVDMVNTVADFTAVVLDNNGAKATLNGLDTITAQSVKTTAYNVTANLQAIVDWYNSVGEGFVTATRSANAGTLPVNIPFTYLSGATDGTITNTEWSNAYTVLQGEDVQMVVPCSSDASIHAMNDAHLQYMSNIARKERRGIVGPALGTSDADALTAAGLLNSSRTSHTQLGAYLYDNTGALVLQPPYIVAAMLAGMFCGVAPGTALTNKSIKVQGMERKLANPTDTDPLVTGGVMCVESTSTGFRVVQSISTWLNDNTYNNVEVSVGIGYDFVARNVRNAVDPLRGTTGSPQTLGQYVSRADTALRAMVKLGVLVGDKTNPPYQNVTAQLAGDVVNLSFQASVGIPSNYVLCTIYAVPYSGTASA